MQGRNGSNSAAAICRQALELSEEISQLRANHSKEPVSEALQPPYICKDQQVHLGELADDLQVTASPAAALLSSGCVASPAAIPPTPDNTSVCALDDLGSVLSSAQQSARAPTDNSSVLTDQIPYAAVNSPSIISNEQVMMEQDEQRELAHQNQASPAFSFADGFAAQPVASPAFNLPDVCNGHELHMGGLADGLQVAASAPLVIYNWAATTAVIPASAHCPANWAAFVSSLQGGSMALSPQAATTPITASPASPATQGTESQSSQAGTPLSLPSTTITTPASPAPDTPPSAVAEDVCGYAAEPNKLCLQVQLEDRKRGLMANAIIKAQRVEVAKCLFSDFEEAGTTATTITASPATHPPLGPQPDGGHILVIGRVVLTSSLSSPFHFRAAQYAA
jgi:hypothetical protein